MTAPFAVELDLDRIEAALAAELPAHVRAAAAAYAAGQPLPPAPPVLSAPATLATAERALRDPDTTPELASRGRALWRQCALLAVDNAVGPRTDAAAGAAGGWPELEALARDREAYAQRRWGRGFLAVAHDVYEVGDIELVARDPARVPPIGSRPVTVAAVEALWRELTELPPPAIVLSAARPRTFAVAPGEAIVVIRAEATVTAWSQIAHELGHAWAAIAGYTLSRTVDEAVAIAAARTLEQSEPAAARVHARHETIAIALAGTERALYAGESARFETLPPWALWHDPGAQAVYVAAWQRGWRVDRLDDLRSRLP